MDDLMDMIISGESSPSEVSDKIKEILYTKSAEKIDAARPYVASTLFGEDEVSNEIDSEEDEDQPGEEE